MLDLIFDQSRFVQRGQCGDWNPVFVYIYITSNLLITAAYLSLPFVMFFQHTAERISKDRIIRYAFGAFILVCGIGHLENVIAWKWPYYHIFTLWHILTAIVSWATICILFRRQGNG